MHSCSVAHIYKANVISSKLKKAVSNMIDVFRYWVYEYTVTSKHADNNKLLELKRLTFSHQTQLLDILHVCSQMFDFKT